MCLAPTIPKNISFHLGSISLFIDKVAMMKKIRSQLFVLLLVFFYSFFLIPVSTLKAENGSRLSLRESFTPMVQEPSQNLRLAEAQIPADSVPEDEILINKKRPFSLKTRPANKKPWYKKWWVWTIVAAVAGGIAAANSDSGSSGGATGGGAQSGSVNITGDVPAVP